MEGENIDKKHWVVKPTQCWRQSYSSCGHFNYCNTALHNELAFTTCLIEFYMTFELTETSMLRGLQSEMTFFDQSRWWIGLICDVSFRVNGNLSLPPRSRQCFERPAYLGCDKSYLKLRCSFTNTKILNSKRIIFWWHANHLPHLQLDKGSRDILPCAVSNCLIKHKGNISPEVSCFYISYLRFHLDSFAQWGFYLRFRVSSLFQTMLPIGAD